MLLYHGTTRRSAVWLNGVLGIKAHRGIGRGDSRPDPPGALDPQPAGIAAAVAPA